MTSLQDLQNAYNNILGAHSPVQSFGQANDAFEVYVLALVLKAARDEGAKISFESTTGVTNHSPLVFRTSPGRIYSTSKDYSHAIVQFEDGLSFEGHVGVYLQGLAGVVHECDVLVIVRDEGIFCRRNMVHPKKLKAALTAECKFYTGKLGIDMGRQFIGVTVDVGNEDRFFLSNSDSKSVDRVLAHHRRQRYFGLSPLIPDSEGQVVAMFRTSFRNRKARLR